MKTAALSVLYNQHTHKNEINSESRHVLLARPMNIACSKQRPHKKKRPPKKEEGIKNHMNT